MYPFIYETFNLNSVISKGFNLRLSKKYETRDNYLKPYETSEK